jgi:hypothetical protein
MSLAKQARNWVSLSNRLTTTVAHEERSRQQPAPFFVNQIDLYRRRRQEVPWHCSLKIVENRIFAACPAGPSHFPLHVEF